MTSFKFYKSLYEPLITADSHAHCFKFFQNNKIINYNNIRIVILYIFTPKKILAQIDTNNLNMCFTPVFFGLDEFLVRIGLQQQKITYTF